MVDSEIPALVDFLDAEKVGAGPVSLAPIGDGHSNLSYLVERGGERFVLRRPPHGQISGSANDVLRESRILEALAGTTVPVPAVLARCEDEGVIGAPFYVMSFVAGTTVGDGLPAELDAPGAPARIATTLARTLAELHAIDPAAAGLDAFGRPSGYLERQLRRFGSLLEENATRPLPQLEEVAAWLAENLPASPPATFVHGDYRLGNVLFGAPLRLAVVLDWELATVGDPLADVGYMTAMWAAPGDAPNPMFALSRATARGDFPDREELARIYAEASGRELGALRWYQVLALWKSAIFLEGSNRRYQAGDSADPYFAGLAEGVPALARAAHEWTRKAVA